MPDLSLKASHQYWNSYDDNMIYRVLTFMEGVEDWTLDGDPQLEAAIAELSEEIDSLDGVDLSELGKEEIFIRLVANIKSSRGLRLLQAIDTVQPGSASRLLIHAEENQDTEEDPSSIFLRRNVIFERLRLLGRVFAEERLNLVIHALEGEEL